MKRRDSIPTERQSFEHIINFQLRCEFKCPSFLRQPAAKNVSITIGDKTNILFDIIRQTKAFVRVGSLFFKIYF